PEAPPSHLRDRALPSRVDRRFLLGDRRQRSALRSRRYGGDAALGGGPDDRRSRGLPVIRPVLALSLVLLAIGGCDVEGHFKMPAWSLERMLEQPRADA